MACGTPVIGSSSGGIPEMVGEAGFIVPERDPSALAAAGSRGWPRMIACAVPCGRRVWPGTGSISAAWPTVKSWRVCSAFLPARRHQANRQVTYHYCCFFIGGTISEPGGANPETAPTVLRRHRLEKVRPGLVADAVLLPKTFREVLGTTPELSLRVNRYLPVRHLLLDVASGPVNTPSTWLMATGSGRRYESTYPQALRRRGTGFGRPGSYTSPPHCLACPSSPGAWRTHSNHCTPSTTYRPPTSPGLARTLPGAATGGPGGHCS